jgi:hypothetical protein
MLTPEILIKAKELKKKHQLIIHDVYEENNCNTVFKGFNSDGDPFYGYEYAPELFKKSDVTGIKIRYYIEIDGIIIHPDELTRVKFDKQGIMIQSEQLKVKIPGERTITAKTFTEAIFEIVRCTYLKNDVVCSISNTEKTIEKTKEDWKKLSNKYNSHNYISFIEYIEKEN